jgi:phosphoglycolate phosphatase-like HAD superfamily hydrolase
VERALVRAVFRWQRARARAQGVTAVEGGATSFLQLFGSALQLTPHFHVLVPEGVWTKDGRFVALPPPDTRDVEAVLHRALRQLRRRLADVEGLHLEAVRAKGVQLALVTNTVEPLASAVIDHARLGQRLPVRATADQVVHAKPVPDLVQLACRGLGVEPGDAWMVGDSKYDRGAAHAAGARFIGLRLDGDLRIEHLREFPLDA